MNRFFTLLKIEGKLSLRGMDMIIFALCLPVVVVVILGFIYSDAPVFLAQSFGAISTIAICAGGIMGLPLVIADYRQKKILKRYKVTPTKPILLLAVQLTIYALYALLSLFLIFIVAFLFFDMSLTGSWSLFLITYLLVMCSLFSIGIMVGGIVPNSKIASIIASILYFPMLLFSGATIPYEIMPTSLQKIAHILPLTHGIKLLKAVSLNQPIETTGIIIMIICLIICSGIALKFFRWE